MVTCECPPDPYSTALRDHFKHLPIYSNLVWFNADPQNARSVAAETLSGISELQISFKQFKTALLTEHTFCKMQVHSLVVSYSSSTGAKLTYTCTSTNGNVTGYATCDTIRFPVYCFNHEIPQEERLHFEMQNIQESCQLSCPGSS